MDLRLQGHHDHLVRNAGLPILFLYIFATAESQFYKSISKMLILSMMLRCLVYIAGILYTMKKATGCRK